MSHRTARFLHRTVEYNPSTSETILEKMCGSFGTELLPAVITPERLVRVSEPAFVTSPDGRNRVLQFQYTRFSPLTSRNAHEVYNKNRVRGRKRELSHESMLKEIEGQNEPWNLVREVTDSAYFENLRVHRWPKGLYFAVYDTEEKPGVTRTLKPFLVYESNTQLEGVLPSVHLTLSIEPFFVVGSMREGTRDKYDSLNINFPRINTEHRNNVESALNLHPLNQLRTPQDAFKEDGRIFSERYRVHSDVPRELTMGFIAAYLRKLCLDKDFY